MLNSYGKLPEAIHNRDIPWIAMGISSWYWRLNTTSNHQKLVNLKPTKPTNTRTHHGYFHPWKKMMVQINTHISAADMHSISRFSQESRCTKSAVKAMVLGVCKLKDHIWGQYFLWHLHGKNASCSSAVCATTRNTKHPSIWWGNY